MRLEKGDWNGAVSLNNRKKVDPYWCFVSLFLFCLFVCSFFLVVIVVVMLLFCLFVCLFFFFLLGEFVSFHMYSCSTFVIVVYFIVLSGK